MPKGAVEQTALAVADLNAQCIHISFLPGPEVSLRSTDYIVYLLNRILFHFEISREEISNTTRMGSPGT